MGPVNYTTLLVRAARASAGNLESPFEEEKKRFRYIEISYDSHRRFQRSVEFLVIWLTVISPIYFFLVNL